MIKPSSEDHHQERCTGNMKKSVNNL